MTAALPTPGVYRHLFLTGPKHVGKSTVLRRLLWGREGRSGGFRTVRREEHGAVALYMLPVGGPDRCADGGRLFLRRDGVTQIDPGGFDAVGVRILAQSASCRRIVMDELGPAEEHAPLFQRAVLDCLDGLAPVYGVLQQAESAFLDRIRRRPDVAVVEVTEAEREDLPRRLAAMGW